MLLPRTLWREVPEGMTVGGLSDLDLTYYAVKAFARGMWPRLYVRLDRVHGDGNRGFVGDELDFLEVAVYAWNLKEDLYLSSEPEYNVDAGLVTRFVLDFDGVSERDGIEAVKRLESYGIESWAIFTGGGIQLYVELEEPVSAKIAKFAGEYIAKEFLGEKFAEALDSNGSSRARFLSRVPCTYSAKRNIVVKLVGSDKCWEKGFEIGLNGGWIVDLVEDFVGESNREIERNPTYFHERKRTVGELPMCARAMVRSLVETGELDHQERVFLASLLLRSGWSYEDLHGLFMFAGDYKEWKTQYHLEYIAARHKTMVMSCRKIQSLGWCPYVGSESRCPFWPWIEPWLRSWDEVGSLAG